LTGFPEYLIVLAIDGKVLGCRKSMAASVAHSSLKTNLKVKVNVETLLPRKTCDSRKSSPNIPLLLFNLYRKAKGFWDSLLFQKIPPHTWVVCIWLTRSTQAGLMQTI
jgi:hypothetical protein